LNAFVSSKNYSGGIMNTDDEMETFLREGLERYYVGAKESVTTFETEIQQRLMQQLETKLDWSNFDARRGERGKNKAVHAGVWEKPGLPAVWAWGYENNGYILELGIQWGVREIGRPFLYTSRWEERFRKLSLSDPRAPVQNHDGKLIVIVGDGFELEAMAAALLSETDRALAGMKPVA
jgi:hypothetical protein